METIRDAKKKLLFKTIGWFMALPIAYLYISLMVFDAIEGREFITYSIFSVLFIVWSEIILRGYKKSSNKRVYFWYIIMCLVALTASISPSLGLSIFALHLCAVYAVLAANNVLYAGKTSGFIVRDLLNGIFVKSTVNLPSIVTEIKSVNVVRRSINASQEGEDCEGNKGDNHSPDTIAYSILVIIVGLILFVVAAIALTEVNEDFNNIVKSLDHIFDWVDLGITFSDFVLRVIFSVPVCIALYSAITGCAKSDGSKELEAGQKILDRQKLAQKVVPNLVNIMLGMFIAMYLLFLVLEAKYIFSGLMGILPSELIVSQYAREGFLQLIVVMIINMVIFLMVKALTNREGKNYKITKGLLISVMFSSVLFAIVSLSKLTMYYASFGYTPKRVLAMWGAIVLMAGAIFVMIYIAKGKDLIRFWIIFVASSYVVLCMVSGVLAANTPKYGRIDDDTVKVSIANYSSEDVSYINVTVHYRNRLTDGMNLGAYSNPDNTTLIPADGGQYDLYLKSDDLPYEDTDLDDYTISIYALNDDNTVIGISSTYNLDELMYISINDSDDNGSIKFDCNH